MDVRHVLPQNLIACRAEPGYTLITSNPQSTVCNRDHSFPCFIYRWAKGINLRLGSLFGRRLLRTKKSHSFSQSPGRKLLFREPCSSRKLVRTASIWWRTGVINRDSFLLSSHRQPRNFNCPSVVLGHALDESRPAIE